MNTIFHILGNRGPEQTQELLKEWLAETLESGGGLFHQELPLQIEKEATSNERRAISGTAGVEEVSRSSLLIDIKGLDVSHFNEFNPVVLACHSQCTMDLMPGAIGTVEKVFKSGNALKFKNMTFDTDPLAEAWWQKVSKGIVRMVSVGIRVFEAQFEEEPPKTKGKPGRLFLRATESELLELSVVSIGANRGAMINPPKKSSKEIAEAEAQKEAIEKLELRTRELETQIQRIKDMEKRRPAERELEAAIARIGALRM